MKKNYFEPEIKLTKFTEDEIITASSGGNDDDEMITLPIIPAP